MNNYFCVKKFIEVCAFNHTNRIAESTKHGKSDLKKVQNVSNVYYDILFSLRIFFSLSLMCYLMYFSNFQVFQIFITGALTFALTVMGECTRIVGLKKRICSVFVKNNPLKTQ